MAKKLYEYKDGQGNVYAYGFHCPGCECGHSFHVAKAKMADGTDVPNNNHPIWQFNGNMEKPTFSPSLLYPDRRCHLFMHDGKIQFLSDCTHKLAGQTVELPDMEDCEL